MTGLLHRLAARAAGTAPTVRSQATLPYRADALAPPSPWRAVDWPAAEPTRPERPIGDDTPADAPDIPWDDIPRRSTRRSGVETVDTAPSPLNLPSPAGQPGERPQDAAPQRDRRGERPSSSATTAARSDHPARGAERDVPGDSRSVWPPEDRPDMPRQGVMRPEQADPPPLLPPGPATSAPRDRRAAAFATDGHAAALSAGPRAPGLTATPGIANEVHVHIGRIEVTALREARPARSPNGTAPPKPRSLDAYLAARDRT